MDKQTIRVPENVKLTFDNDIEGCRVLIIEAVKEVTEVNKNFRGKLMEEELELEVGKWYRSEGGCCHFLYKGSLNEGFIDGEWYSNLELADDEVFKPVDMKEVEKLMIAEAEERFKKGDKLYGDGEYFYEGCHFDHQMGCLINKEFAAVVYSPEKGWAEIIEPLFINSHGSKFYEGDASYYVHKKTLEIIPTWKLVEYSEDYKDDSEDTEIMTKEQAEQYVKDNRVFEDNAHYKAVYKNENTCAWYSADFNHFYLNTHVDIIKRIDFDSIGEKIEF